LDVLANLAQDASKFNFTAQQENDGVNRGVLFPVAPLTVISSSPPRSFVPASPPEDVPPGAPDVPT